jgi:hypothetical protein
MLLNVAWLHSPSAGTNMCYCYVTTRKYVLFRFLAFVLVFCSQRSEGRRRCKQARHLSKRDALPSLARVSGSAPVQGMDLTACTTAYLSSSKNRTKSQYVRSKVESRRDSLLVPLLIPLRNKAVFNCFKCRGNT